jgi:hypothetical protein
LARVPRIEHVIENHFRHAHGRALG